MERRALAHRQATRHVAAYLLRPAQPRPPLALAGGEDEPGVAPAEGGELAQREGRAIEALAKALLERATLASAEADLIVDVARGDATPEDLRHYRAINRQSRCGFE